MTAASRAAAITRHGLLPEVVEDAYNDAPVTTSWSGEHHQGAALAPVRHPGLGAGSPAQGASTTARGGCARGASSRDAVGDAEGHGRSGTRGVTGVGHGEPPRGAVVRDVREVARATPTARHRPPVELARVHGGEVEGADVRRRGRGARAAAVTTGIGAATAGFSPIRPRRRPARSAGRGFNHGWRSGDSHERGATRRGRRASSDATRRPAAGERSSPRRRAPVARRRRSVGVGQKPRIPGDHGLRTTRVIGAGGDDLPRARARREARASGSAVTRRAPRGTSSRRGRRRQVRSMGDRRRRQHWRGDGSAGPGRRIVGLRHGARGPAEARRAPRRCTQQGSASAAGQAWSEGADAAHAGPARAGAARAQGSGERGRQAGRWKRGRGGRRQGGAGGGGAGGRRSRAAASGSICVSARQARRLSTSRGRRETDAGERRAVPVAGAAGPRSRIARFERAAGAGEADVARPGSAVDRNCDVAAERSLRSRGRAVAGRGSARCRRRESTSRRRKPAGAGGCAAAGARVFAERAARRAAGAGGGWGLGAGLRAHPRRRPRRRSRRRPCCRPRRAGALRP